MSRPAKKTAQKKKALPAGARKPRQAAKKKAVKKPAAGDERTWAKTWRDLAEKVNKSKSTVYDWSQNPDAPKPDPKRGHCVEEWLKYKRAREGDPEESGRLTDQLKESQLRLNEERIEAQQIENRKRQGESADFSEVVAVLSDSFIQLCRDMLAMENTVIPDLSGTVTENKRRYRAEVLRLLESFSVGDTEAASDGGKKKPFWNSVSAALVRLQADLPRGNGEIATLGWDARMASTSGAVKTLAS